jgi:hypothetical protein
MARIVAPASAYTRTPKGPRFELSVAGATKPLVVLIAREFGEAPPEEAHAVRLGKGMGRLMLFPIGHRQRHEEDWVFAIDQFDPVDGERVNLNYGGSDASLSLVSLYDHKDTALFVGNGEDGDGLGFAVLLDEGDRIQSDPLGREGRVWVAWNEGGFYRKELMTEDRYEELFGWSDDDLGWDELGEENTFF